MTKQTKIAAGLLAGAALGAAIVLIISSDKNDNLKEKIGDWFCDLLDSSKDKVAGIGDLLKSTVDKAKA